MFYFKYQLKLEFIPYVEEEVSQFITMLQARIQTMDEDQRAVIKKVMQKKIRDIEKFYDFNYEDYRAHLILRSKSLLENFWINNSECFQIATEQGKEEIKEEEKTHQPEIRKPAKTLLQKTMSPSLKPAKTQRFELLAQSKKKAWETEKGKEEDRKRERVRTEGEGVGVGERGESRSMKSPQRRRERMGVIEEKDRTGRGKKKERNPEKKMSKEEYIKYLRNKKQ